MQYSVSLRFSSDRRVGVIGDDIAISIKSPAGRGKANRELVKKLAEQFEGSEYKVKIISGLTSRKKIVEIP